MRPYVNAEWRKPPGPDNPDDDERRRRAAAGSPFHSRAEAATAVRTADLLILTFLFLIMIGGYHVHAMLTMGDWDFWVDWKDRRMWPTVLPIMLVTFPAAAQYFFWEHF
ncbi:MAG: methane monooxygenase/ammonia monooxygenase subunit A, partial [Methylocella sp.]